LSFYSKMKNQNKRFSLSALLLVLGGCGLEYVEPNREFVQRQVDKYSPNEIPGEGRVLNQDIYPAANFMSACSWLDSMVISDNSGQQAFRSLEDFGTKKFSTDGPFGIIGEVFDGRLLIEKAGIVKASEFSEDTSCEENRRVRPRDGHRDRGRIIVENSVEKCKQRARLDALHDRSLMFGDDSNLINLNNLYGRIQLNDHPLLEYGLLAQSGSERSGGSIPNESEFHDLFNDEITKSPILLLPMIGLKLLMRTGVVGWEKIRNKAFTDKIGESLPGVYDESFELYPLQGTYADVFVKNGFPYSEILKPLPTDSREVIERKDAELRRVLEQMAKRVPMFRNNSWSAFLDDMRYGMSAAIRGIKSTSPIEQACGTVIYHRAFSQLLTIKGYDRAPLKITGNGSKRRKALVGVSDFLDHNEGTRMKACRRSGSFLRDGKLTQVKDSELADEDVGLKMTLTDKPNPSEECTLSEARPLLEQKEQPTYVESARGYEEASFHEKVEFLGGIAYFMMSLVPGTDWWFSSNSPVPYPLADFGSNKEAEDIIASGGMLPFEAFAISLAYINMVGMPIVDNHVVYVDIDGKEVDADDPKVTGVRISATERKAFAKGPVVTELKSVSLMTDVVFKLHDALEILADWHAETEESLRLLSGNNSTATKKMRQEYESFMNGILGSDNIAGSKRTLNLLIDDSKGSLRDQLKSLKLALSLLLNKFAVPRDLEDLSQGYTCVDELHLDPVTGIEKQVGRCSEVSVGKLQSDDELWRQSMRLVGRAFQSPLFLEMAGP